MKSLQTIIIVFILNLFFISSLHTQTEQEEKKKEQEYAHDHQEIIVTAKREPITEIANIKEIKREEIEKRGALDPVEALDFIPGAFYTVGSRGETNLQLRGFSQRQIVIMIDGIPINLPYSGEIDLSHFPLEGLAKIKVTKGTSSSVYGSNTMGGIINLITETPKKRTNAHLSLELGRNLNQKFAFSLAKRWEKIGFWISGEYKNSEGFHLSHKFKPEINEDGARRQNSDFTNRGVNGRFHYSWKKGSFFLDFNYLDNKRGAPPHVSEDRPRYWRFPTWRKNNLKLSLKHNPFQGLELRGSVYYDLYYNILDSYDDATYSTQEQRYSFQSIYDDYSLGASFLGELSKGKNHLRLGLNLKKDVHRSQGDEFEPWEKYEAANYSLGIEDEIDLKDNLSLVLGTSLDWLKPVYANGEELRDPIFHFNPLVGLSYRVNSFQVYFSMARKSRFPTLKELYSEYIGRNIANPELKEEKSMNYELGFHFLASAVSLDVSIFYSDLKDLIVQKRTGALYQMQNVDQAVYSGAEFSLNFPIKEGYDLSFNYAYLQAKNTSSDRTSSKLEYKPPHKLALFFSFRLPYSIEGMVKSAYTGKRYFEDRAGNYQSLSPYMLWDLRLSKNLGRFEIYFLLKNILDVNYEFEDGFPGPGREILIGFTWKN